jgi:hypothetical protein
MQGESLQLSIQETHPKELSAGGFQSWHPLAPTSLVWLLIVMYQSVVISLTTPWLPHSKMLAFALQTLVPDVIMSTYNTYYEPVSKRCEGSFNFFWTNDIADWYMGVCADDSDISFKSCSRSILEILGVLLRFWDLQMMAFWARTSLCSWTRMQKCWNSCLSLCTLVHNLTYKLSSSKRRPP